MLLCDYDGTLAPIVADPMTACVPSGVAQAWTALVQHPRYDTAVVSGRALADLQTRVDAQTRYLAGNHGLEILGPDVLYCHPEARQHRPHILALAQDLQDTLTAFPGVWVEHKGLTLTVHLRRVPAMYVASVQRQVLRRLRPALETQRMVLRTGKAVLEVRPAVHWDKGSAVRWIVEHVQTGMPAARLLPIYIGDDETDEDAFHALGSTGLGVVVGAERLASAAHYMVASVEQVAYLLAVLSGVR